MTALTLAAVMDPSLVFYKGRLNIASVFAFMLYIELRIIFIYMYNKVLLASSYALLL